MKAMIDFFRTMMTLPKPWIVWVMLLMMANMVLPLFYLGTPEAQIVLASFLIGAIAQTAIFSAKGFVRLLGTVPRAILDRIRRFAGTPPRAAPA